MASRPCPECFVEWPPGYLICPSCEIKTGFERGGTPVSREEAALLRDKAKAYKDFEEYYAEREADLRARGFTTPEERGAEDARKLIEGWRSATIALNSGEVPD